MNRISVLIPDAEAQISKRVALCLKASGRAIVHGFSRLKSAPLRHSSLFATFDCSIEEMDQSSWLRRVDELLARRQIDVVLPISDFGIRTLSEHGHSLGCANRIVQLPEPQTFDTATNKASLTEFLTVHGVPQPRTVVVTAGAHISEDLSALTFPLLAKPSLSAGGYGIHRCESRAELDAFLATKSEGETWVVQEFVDGTDLGVNVLCQDGKIIASTVQHAIDKSPRSYQPATGWEFENDSSAIDVAKRLIERLSWSGVANIDMRYDMKRKAPVVLELNGRYWTTLLGSMNAGVNFPLLACEAVCGSISSNRQARNARYFRGRSNMLWSLVGGGKYRIRPGETDLRYFIKDPLRLAGYLGTKTAESVRGKLPRPYTPAGGRR